MLTPAIPRSHAEVSQSVFTGVLWTFIALSLVLVLFRLVIRLRTFRRLYWDDACVILAWLMFLASAILYRLNMHRVYKNYQVTQGKRPFDTEAQANWDYFMHLIVPFNVLFYSSLWAVKISFLLFFKQLGDRIWKYRLWWWCVLAITLAAYIGCIGDIQYDCTRPAKSFLHIIQNCDTLESISWVMKTLYANCALDVGTDILILSIPTLILWNAGVPLRKKIVLFSIFSVTTAIMTIAIIRVTVVNSPKQSAEIAWLYFWSSVEVGTAIMISCVASFRQLFVATREQPWSPASNQVNFKRTKSLVRSNGEGSIQIGRVFKRCFSCSKSESTCSEEDQSPNEVHPLEFVTVHNLQVNSSS